MAELDKEELEHIKYVWEGIKTGVAKTHHYKVQMIKMYNDYNRAGYKYTTNCASCLGTMFRWWQQLVEDNGIVKPKKKKKTKKSDGENT